MNVILLIAVACLVIFTLFLLRLARKNKKTSHSCVYCKKTLGSNEAYKKVKEGNVFYHKVGTTVSGVYVGNFLVEVRGRRYMASCPPGRVCMHCWESFIPANKIWAERKEFERRERERERKEKETIRNPVWVLQNMPLATQHTLHRWRL